MGRFHQDGRLKNGACKLVAERWHQRTLTANWPARLRQLIGTYGAEAKPNKSRSGAEQGANVGRSGVERGREKLQGSVVSKQGTGNREQ